jgi:DNA (cytosine-5)-methyltransferase 1
MHELALFAGAGGGLLASHLLGWRTVCAVEIDSYCQQRLLDRQRDGCLPRFPIWDDVRTFDGRPWRGHVDVISGGFPCQDISAAGKGAGIAGSRSGLVFEMLRIVEEVRPSFVFAENSPHFRTKGLATIVERFISMGYVGRVGVLGAGDIGANHRRKRMWIVAISKFAGELVADAADTNGAALREQQGRLLWEGREGTPKPGVTDWWSVPRFAGVDDGMADRMERVKATGNGQVPGVAALAWSVLTSDLCGGEQCYDVTTR